MDTRVYVKSNGEKYVFRWDSDCLTSFRCMLLMMDLWERDPDLSWERTDSWNLTAALRQELRQSGKSSSVIYETSAPTIGRETTRPPQR